LAKRKALFREQILGRNKDYKKTCGWAAHDTETKSSFSIAPRS